MSLLDAALTYAELGWYVFPCNPLNKRPLTEHGVKDATVDETTIRTWWGSKWPSAMIAVATGTISGLLVLDIDIDAGRGINGEEALSRRLNGNALPEELTSVRTPRGGRHIYFAYPEGRVIRNSAGKLGKGLDVRAQGGYVICPPSVNGDGIEYRWDPEQWGVLYPAPEWLLSSSGQLLPREIGVPASAGSDEHHDAYGDAALKYECDAIAAASKGQRNDQLFRSACKLFELVAGGVLGESEVRAALLAAGIACGLPPFEAGKTIDSAQAHGLQRPRRPKLRDHVGNGAAQHNGILRPAASTDYGANATPPLVEPLATFSIGGEAHLPLEPREFLDSHGFILMNAVHVMNGDGGIGKTDIACQMLVAAHTGSPAKLFGLPSKKQGPVLMFSAEEPKAEIRRRIHTICDAEVIDPLTLTDLHIIDYSRQAAWLFEADRHGKLVRTSLYKCLRRTVAAIQPVLLVIDNRMRIFAGNQNDSVLATSVITELDSLGFENSCAVVLLSHPSISQIGSGRGDSGSVSWANAGRSRSFLDYADKNREANAEDDGRRVLTNLKANYGKPGRSVEFTWEDGRFRCLYEPPKAGEDIGQADKAERVFLDLLLLHNKQNIRVSASTAANNYAPKVFSRHAKAERVSTPRFTNAMWALLEKGSIENVRYGAPSKDTYRLKVAEP